MPRVGNPSIPSQVDFDIVPSVGAGVVIGTVQRRTAIPSTVRLMRAVGQASALGTGGDHQFAVFVTPPGETPVQVIPNTTLAAANTPVTALALATAAGRRVFPVNSILELRAVTPATTGSMTNLAVTIEAIYEGWPNRFARRPLRVA